MAKPRPTAERVRHLLNYDPGTGVFTRRVDVTGGYKHLIVVARAGSTVGTPMKIGYLNVSVDGRQYYAHRLAWLWMTGEWPTLDIDHVDGIKTNNAWLNLREVSRSINLQNQQRVDAPKRKIDTLGVYFDRNRKVWRSKIKANKKTTYVGSFPTKESAIAGYIAAKKKHHPGMVDPRSLGVEEGILDKPGDSA